MKAIRDEVDKVREMILTTPVDGFIGCCRAIQEMDQRNDLGEINLPVLVIAGAEDPGTTPAMNKAIADAIPGADMLNSPAPHTSATYRRRTRSMSR